MCVAIEILTLIGFLHVYSSKGEQQEESSDTSKECDSMFHFEVVIHQDGRGRGSGALHD